jgi:hypothetical protein
MGLHVHCTKYTRVKSSQAKSGGALRCARFAKNQGGRAQSPICDKRLVGGGRSKGLLRPSACKRTRYRALLAR